MVDHSFTDLTLAALYDSLNPWGPGDDFYLGLVREARAVLDIGCGTGRLLRRARAEGHPGRLMGLDPAAAMLVQARRARPGDVEWVLGDMQTRMWQGEFDLVVMTGHAFQQLTGDEGIRRLLHAVREALGPGGRFVFETRNPADRAWEGWTPEHVHAVTAADGTPVRVWHEVQDDGLHRGRLRFTTTYASDGWPAPRVSHGILRFLDDRALRDALKDAGLSVVAQYGDWKRTPLTATTPEIITVAERAR